MLVYTALLDDSASRSLFEETYYLYKSLMYTAAYSILQNTRDAEDAVHDAFLSIADHMYAVEDPQSRRTRAFVLTVTESRAIDILRRRRGELSLDDESTPQLPARREDGDMAYGVAYAMASLPGESRRLLLLRYDMGFSTGEIARMLGKSRAAVAKGLTRAKARLREALKKEGIQID